MGLRDKMRRLELATRHKLRNLEQCDGSRHFYDPTSPERFLHSLNCLRAHGECEPFRPPLEDVRAIAMAKDRAGALAQVYGNDGSFTVFPYDEEALVRRGEIVPRSVVAGRKLGEPLENSPSRSGVW